MTHVVGLYVHIPFCASICSYCDFYRIATGNGIPGNFEDLLLKEAALYAREEPLFVDTVYFGGGTPSLFAGERLQKLLAKLGGIFAISDGAEITLEANPEDVTADVLAAWKGAGVTRLSIGIQSFDGEVLRRLKRGVSPDRAVKALAETCDAGFDHLSADFMTGVPGQNVKSFQRDLETAAAFNMDHLSVYALDLHSGTRLYNDVAKGRESLPSDDTTSTLLELAHDYLAGLGFEHYEISNFALPGGKSCHNLKYWRCEPTIGLGPSAWSRFGGVVAGNHRRLSLWMEDVEAGRLPRDSVEEVGPVRLVEDRIIFGLRLSDGIEWTAAAEALGLDRCLAEDRAARLSASGRAVFENGVLSLTPSGFLVSTEAILYLLDND